MGRERPLAASPHAQRTRPLARGASRRTVGVRCGARHGPLKGHAGGHERHADVRRRTSAACLARPCGDRAHTAAPARGRHRLCGLGGGTRAAPTRVAGGASSRCAGRAPRPNPLQGTLQDTRAAASTTRTLRPEGSATGTACASTDLTHPGSGGARGPAGLACFSDFCRISTSRCNWDFFFWPERKKNHWLSSLFF